MLSFDGLRSGRFVKLALAECGRLLLALMTIRFGTGLSCTL
jgi:hypothetical protein